MPNADPGRVSLDPLADEGIKLLSSVADPAALTTNDLGKSPIDDESLAVLADDDVGRLDIAVQDAPGVGVVDGVAHVDEPPKQPAQGQRPTAGLAL